jgi:16S rRNA (cytosine1402-N4)-methyltransferase
MTMAAVSIQERIPYEHVPVMLDEVVAALAPERGGVFVDVTVGGGGHARALLAASPSVRLWGFDRDPRAVLAARENLAEFAARARIEQARFSEVEARLAAAGVEGVAGVLADLGVSSAQLDDADRGLSFRREGPLDMRMDPTRGESALALIRRSSQDELADLIYELGEERRSRRVARCIKQALDADELHTTLDLRRAVVRAVGPQRVGGVDPATRTFQALRMAVNEELEELGALLDVAPRVLASGGVFAVMSFHSLEDRLVKRAFRNQATWQALAKKPVIPSEREQSENPRARSAKLRAARRASTPTVEEVR